MIRRNQAFSYLTGGYLFPEIAKRRAAFAASHPGKKIISLGVGNTTEPLTPHITGGLAAYARGLGTREGYTGYGEDQGLTALREKISAVFYPGLIGPEEIFLSDGAKCDIGRLQLLFGRGVPVAVQDPAYPVYVDGSVLIGAAGKAGPGGYAGVTYMPCTAENAFFPDLSAVPENSLIYFCSPNNPTGAASTRAQLQTLVDTARARGCVIIFDGAYASFIRDPSLPRTIFEIPGAKECALEVNSFSKPAGFTGVRLGWTAVPRDLKYADGSPVIADWNRVMTTVFNGASNIAQAGGLAALDAEGLSEMRSVTDFYLENSRIIRTALEGPNFKKAGVSVYGGGNSPYLWVKFPQKQSWQVFDSILNQCSVVTTPGSGFGPAGEGYVRFSSFGHREDIVEAAGRLGDFSVCP
ncbi:MAG: LL-diaminopimelate aminotransferase [Spirochaetaceae bacterium]|jgi:LL-diaminopimelate aminotransferase|nr:LL-diaminopimelate aminotransferase [Spirochaetaceae bacterium]